ncbi:hypothetical protein PHJA_001901200 [Phtheirospermum japonicum]|uniref:Uncharacterized protein n=1 Tax=Phtheirospermum japonicum TaxID=374723 RepID=A0A830CTC0_9LAMI|nr:hypothetical protein PHJA_001901200 [Phtheirospermum japonicum]
MEVEPPSVVRYLIGSAIMMLGVVLPVVYMMFRNKSSFFFLLLQTDVDLPFSYYFLFIYIFVFSIISCNPKSGFMICAAFVS